MTLLRNLPLFILELSLLSLFVGCLQKPRTTPFYIDLNDGITVKIDNREITSPDVYPFLASSKWVSSEPQVVFTNGRNLTFEYVHNIQCQCSMRGFWSYAFKEKAISIPVIFGVIDEYHISTESIDLKILEDQFWCQEVAFTNETEFLDTVVNLLSFTNPTAIQIICSRNSKHSLLLDTLLFISSTKISCEIFIVLQ